jgi:hypothetical protein
MMTRQNYEMVAGVLRMQVDNLLTVRAIEDDAELGHERSQSAAVTLSSTAYNLTQKFAADNPRFDHKVFYAACGFTVINNYPLVFTDQRG